MRDPAKIAISITNNRICVNIICGFLRCVVIIPSAIHDNQMHPIFIDYQNQDNYL